MRSRHLSEKCSSAAMYLTRYPRDKVEENAYSVTFIDAPWNRLSNMILDKIRIGNRVVYLLPLDRDAMSTQALEYDGSFVRFLQGVAKELPHHASPPSTIPDSTARGASARRRKPHSTAVSPSSRQRKAFTAHEMYCENMWR